MRDPPGVWCESLDMGLLKPGLPVRDFSTTDQRAQKQEI
jgi:hypothetical protein